MFDRSAIIFASASAGGRVAEAFKLDVNLPPRLFGFQTPLWLSHLILSEGLGLCSTRVWRLFEASLGRLGHPARGFSA